MSVYCWDRVSQQPSLLPAIQRWKLLVMKSAERLFATRDGGTEGSRFGTNHHNSSPLCPPKECWSREGRTVSGDVF